MAVRNNVLHSIPAIPAPIRVIFILFEILVQFTFVAIQIVAPFTEFRWFVCQFFLWVSLFQSAILLLGFMIVKIGIAIIPLGTRVARELLRKVPRRGTRRPAQEDEESADVSHSSDRQVALPDPVHRPIHRILRLPPTR